jgi:hypothetical protein
LSIYGRLLCSDFLQFSTFVTEQLNIKTWESCNNHEKKFLIDCNIKESSISSINDIINKQDYLQSEEGMTEQMSINYINARFSDFADNQRESCRRRIESKDLCACLAKYLTSSDVRLLTAQVKDEYSYFHNYGYKDLLYFIESSNGRESDGLEQQGYTLNSGTISDLRNELLLILKDGVYGSL